MEPLAPVPIFDPHDATEEFPDLTVDKAGWFEFWDEDGSGTLDEGELLRALVHSFHKKGRREEIRSLRDIVRNLLAACDVSGDGVIQRDEFLAEGVGLADVIKTNFGFLQDAPPPTVPAPPPPAVDNVRPPSWNIEIRTN